METISIVVLSSYFLLIIFSHFVKNSKRKNFLETFGLVPRWNFFAPTPGVHNYYLLFRYKYSSGKLGVWKSIYNLDKFRKVSTTFWNPEKRLRKAIFDLFSVLIQEDASTPENKIIVRLSIPYLLVLNKLSKMNAPPSSIAIQFLILENFHEEVTNPIFTSDMHPL